MNDLKAPRCLEPYSFRKMWVIVHELGNVPQMKKPMKQTHEAVEQLLRELFECRPEGTRLIVCTLTYSFDLDVEDGRVYLDMGDVMRNCDPSASTCAEGNE